MIDKKTCMLNNISFYIAQKLQQLIENKIAENLQVLNDDVSQNIDNLIEFTKETIILISKYSIEKQDCLNKKILEIKEHIKNIRQNQNDISEKRTNFIKVKICFNM